MQGTARAPQGATGLGMSGCMPRPSSSHHTPAQSRPSAAAYCVPKEAHEAIQGLEGNDALDALIKGAVSGLWPIEAVATWRAAQRNGKEVVAQVLRPLPEAMQRALAAADKDSKGIIVMRGMKDGLWSPTDVDAYFANQRAYHQRRLAPSKRDMVYRTRRSRLRPKPTIRPSQFVPKIVLDTMLDVDLSDGAKVTLAVVLALAGKSDRLVTMTASLATQRGCSARTIQNHLNALHAAGWLKYMWDHRKGLVTLLIAPHARPKPYEPGEIEMLTDIARKSAEPEVREAFQQVVSTVRRRHPGDLVRAHRAVRNRETVAEIQWRLAEQEFRGCVGRGPAQIISHLNPHTDFNDLEAAVRQLQMPEPAIAAPPSQPIQRSPQTATAMALHYLSGADPGTRMRWAKEAEKRGIRLPASAIGPHQLRLWVPAVAESICTAERLSSNRIRI